MTKKARPSRVKKSEHSEGLGRLFTRPPRPNRAQRDMHHPFVINGHVRFLGEQNQRIGQLPANPSAFLSFPVSFSNLSELEREVAGSRPTGVAAPPAACLPASEVHLRVSVTPSSGFAVVPLAVTRAHNPRVVGGAAGSPSRTLTGSDPATAGPGES
jgi:hypothetical protein